MRKYAILLGTILVGFASALSYAQPPVPFVSLPLVPDATAPGGPDFTLAVNGTGFVSNSAVNWNGTALATEYVSGSQLTATVPAADIAKPGTGQITVVTPAPGGGTSAALTFEVTKPISLFTFNWSDYTGGTNPGSVAVADFNGDGNLDIAAGIMGSKSVMIYLGNGQGGFKPRGEYAAGGSTDSVVVGDFNGDGKLDIATRGGAVLLGNGDGSFQPPISFVCGLDTTDNGGIAVGDFTGDGNLDIVGTDNATGQVCVLLGNGDGTFQAPVYYAAGAGAWGIAVGDFNGDGSLDLAVNLSGADEVAILLGNGNGTFQPEVIYPIGGEDPWELYTADLNGDGALDLVLPISDGASVLLGNGDGTFRPYVIYPVPGVFGRGAVADVNGDGKPDLVMTSGWGNWGSGWFYVLLGNGDGTFQQPTTYMTGAGCPLGMAVGDFNKDGLLDMVFGDWCDSPISVSLGAVVSLAPDTLAFGTVALGQQSSLTVQLTNIQNSALKITGIAISGGKGAYSQTNNCGNSVAAGQFCTVTVTFAPGTTGSFAGEVLVGDNAAGTPQRVFLSGRGSSAAVARR